MQYLWDGRVLVLMDHECLGTLGSSMFLFFSFSCGNLLKGHNGICYPIFFIQQNRGNPTKASDN
jgi:hypothetical protein